MTPDEIRAARHALNMTHRQFGEALGVQEQTARRWEMPETAKQSRKPSASIVLLIGKLKKPNSRNSPAGASPATDKPLSAKAKA